MSAKEKGKFEDMAKADKARYEREMKTYIPPKGETKKKFKDPNAPKRPPSAFFLFCSEYRPKIKGEHPGLSIGDVAKKLGEMWNNTAVDDKQRYEKKAAELKKKYGDFAYPKVSLSVGGKLLKDNRAKLVLTDVTVDVSVGYEASILTFSLYQVYDEASGSYRLKDFKDYVMLGSKAEISMGYGEKLEKLFVGFISQVRYVKEQETIHHVEVTAMDIKGIMMANGCARQLSAGNFGDGVKEIFDKSLYQKLKAEGIFAGAKIMDTPDKKDACTLEMVWESDYEFVVKAAKYFNYEFFVERGTVYFRRAKETGEASLLELSCEEGLSFYDISYDITGLVKKWKCGEWMRLRVR